MVKKETVFWLVTLANEVVSLGLFSTPFWEGGRGRRRSREMGGEEEGGGGGEKRID